MADALRVPKQYQPPVVDAEGRNTQLPPAPSDAAIRVPKSMQPPSAPQAGRLRDAIFQPPLRRTQPGEGLDVPDLSNIPYITPVVNGFNSRLVELTGLPLDGLNKVWGELAGEGFLDTNESGADAIRRKLTEYGVPAPVIDGEISRIGSQLFDNLAVAAITLGAGNFITATTPIVGEASSAVGQIGQNLLRTAAAHPGPVIVSEVGSAIGQHTIGPALEPTIGQQPAEMVGAMMGGMVPDTTAARILARLGGGAAGAAAGALGGAITTHPMLIGLGTGVGAMRGSRAARNAVDRLFAGKLEHHKALANMSSPTEATEYARAAVKGDILEAEEAISKAVASIGGIADPTRQAEKLHSAVNTLYNKAQSNASVLWGKVDQSLPVTKAVPDLKQFADTMRATAGEFNEGLPEEFLSKIDIIASNLGAGKAVDTKMAPDGSVEIIRTPGHVFSIQDLRNIQQSINAKLREGVHNNVMRSNLVSLRNAIDDAVAKVYPNDGTLRAARDYTRWLHETFSEGALGAFYGKDRPKGTFLSAPEAKALQLVKSEKGGRQMADAALQLRSKALEGRIHNFLAAEFQERANDLGPEKGLEFLQSPSTQNYLHNFPREAARMERAATQLRAALDTRNAIKEGYFARYAGMDPQSAVSVTLSGPNKVQRVKAVMEKLIDDERGLAVESFQGELLKQTFARVKNDPARMQALLADKDMRAAFTAAFGEKMPRLDRLLESLAKYGGSKADLAMAKMDEAAGGVGGAVLGRNVPGGGLVAPQRFGTVMAWATRQLFGRIPVDELTMRAIEDPKWEAYVHSKVPVTLTEMRTSVDQIVALLALTEGSAAGFTSGREE